MSKTSPDIEWCYEYVVWPVPALEHYSFRQEDLTQVPERLIQNITVRCFMIGRHKDHKATVRDEIKSWPNDRY